MATVAEGAAREAAEVLCPASPPGMRVRAGRMAASVAEGVAAAVAAS